MQDEGISDISVTHHRILGLSGKDLQDIVELTGLMLAHVETRIDEERARVLEVVRTKPLKEILSQNSTFTMPNRPNPFRPRSRGARKKKE